MAQEVLNVEIRESTGKRRNKRLRMSGKIPAVLYGHGQETVAVMLDAGEISTVLRHNAHIVKLEGAATDSALLKEIHWDAFGNSVLHIDLTRVDADEAVEVDLEIVLRGQAPGIKQGGVVEHQLNHVRVECPASSIPQNLELNVNSLELGQSMTIADLVLPPGARALVPDETPIASCVEPVEAGEEEAATVESAEPEVIGAKPEEEGES